MNIPFKNPNPPNKKPLAFRKMDKSEKFGKQRQKTEAKTVSSTVGEILQSLVSAPVVLAVVIYFASASISLANRSLPTEITVNATEALTRPNISQTANIVSVLSYGAKGDGITDDKAALQAAINAGTDGDIIDLGSGRTYLVSGTLTLKQNRTYRGTSTIKLSTSASDGSPLILAPYGLGNNITIDGLTLDANRRGGALHLGSGGGSTAPIKNFVLKNSTVKNAKTGEPWLGAVYNPVGVENVTIANNKFSQGGLHLTNTQNLIITQNDFQDIIGNAMFIASYKNSNSIYVTKNTGRNIKRMAVEIWGGSQNAITTDILVEDNNFRDWPAKLSGQTGPAYDNFGISVVAGAGTVRNNQLINGNGPYGIEVTSNSIVEGNTVSGFSNGVIVGGSGITVKSNRFISNTYAGIIFSNCCSIQNSKILTNYIENPKEGGITANVSDIGGSEISGNTIVRQAGFYSDDNTRAFYGIKVDAGSTRAVLYKDNTLQQTATIVPSGFNFRAFGIFGKIQSGPGHVFDGNTIESKSTISFGYGFYLWVGGLLDWTTIRNSKFVNLSNVSNGTSKNITVSNNVVMNVTTTDPNIITATMPAPTPDTQKPTISILSPAPNSQTQTASVSLSGLAADNIGVTSVIWTNSRGGSGTTAGTSNWSINNVALQEGSNLIIVTAKDAAGNSTAASVTVTYVAPTPTTSCPTQIPTGSFLGCYYDNQDFTAFKFSRSDAYPLANNWGSSSPDPRIGVDTFSAVWAGQFDFSAGEYEFTGTGNDGFRIYIDGKKVMDAFGWRSTNSYTFKNTLTAGRHTVKIEYFEETHSAQFSLKWTLKTAQLAARSEAMSNLSYNSVDNYGRNDEGSNAVVPKTPVITYGDIQGADRSPYHYTLIADNNKEKPSLTINVTFRPTDSNDRTGEANRKTEQSLGSVVISGIHISSISSRSAAISWNASVSSFENNSASSSITAHTITLTDLKPGTLYDFRIQMVNGGLQVSSGDFRFNTLPEGKQ